MLAEGADFAEVIARAKHMLAEEMGLTHVTLEPETRARGCADHEGACPSPSPY